MQVGSTNLEFLRELRMIGHELASVGPASEGVSCLIFRGNDWTIKDPLTYRKAMAGCDRG